MQELIRFSPDWNDTQRGACKSCYAWSRSTKKNGSSISKSFFSPITKKIYFLLFDFVFFGTVSNKRSKTMKYFASKTVDVVLLWSDLAMG